MEASGVASDQVDAFDTEYGSLFGELTRLCGALGAGSSAEDVAQEALIEGRSRLTQLRDPERLRPWLRTIAVRKTLRQRRRLPALGLEDEPAFVPVSPDLGLDASAAIRRLPERERTAVVLVHGLGYTQEEAADMMGVRRGTIAASLWKARRKLARELAGYREGSRR